MRCPVLLRDENHLKSSIIRFSQIRAFVVQFVIIAFSAALLAGCKSMGGEPSGQVVAVVDGRELTTAQLEQMLVIEGVSPQDSTPEIRAQAFNNLIDQSLIVAAAEKQGLDKTPDFTRQLDQSRKLLLSQQYFAKMGSSQIVTPTEVSQYYASHPYLYENRRRYTLSDVPVKYSSGIERYITLFNAPSATLEGLVSALKADGVSATISTKTLTADELPTVLAEKLSSMTPGTNVTFKMDDVQHFARIDSASLNPVALDLARNQIESIIQSEQFQRIANNENQRLRKAAKIELGQIGKSIMASGRANDNVTKN